MNASSKASLCGCVLIIMCSCFSAGAQDETIGAYEPQWQGTDSLAWRALIESYSIPQWYEDGKFGLYLHWGIFQVPAKDLFYGDYMYLAGHAMFNYHKATFGDQKTFGYKDFIPMYKMDKFDPEAWAELFLQAGAKYIMPIAIFHDGLAQYKSNIITKFNLVDYPGGCGKDVVRMMEKSVRKRGLKFGVAHQYLENWGYYCHNSNYDTSDPANQELYNTGVGAPCGSGSTFWDYTAKAPKSWMDKWLATVKEQIEFFQPDILFFDCAIYWADIFDMNYKAPMAKYYYDDAAKLGKQVALNTKWRAFPEGTMVYDREWSSESNIRNLFWQSDTPLGNYWGYAQGYNCNPPAGMIRLLAENCANNGSLMAAIGNLPDGTLPPCIATTLQGMGAWLKVNGEAIYGTRPWKIQKEGPSPSVGQSGSRFTTSDIRFTASKAWTEIYAIGLGWPGSTMNIASMKSGSFDVSTIDSVYLIGRGKVTCTQDAAGLKVAIGATAPIANYPYAVKIFLKMPVRDAFAKIEAESCTNKRMGAIKVKTCSEGGQCLDSARSNDWAAYPRVNFGTGAGKFTARVSAATVAFSNIASIQVHLDDPSGPLVGTLRGACPGGVNNYTELTCNLTAPAAGVHDLYLVLNPGFRSYNLNWFQFTAGVVGTRPSSTPGVNIQRSAGSELVELYDLKGRLVARGDRARAVFSGGTQGHSLCKGIYLRKTRVENLSSTAELFINDASTLNGKKFRLQD